MISLEEARRRILGRLVPLGIEPVALGDALGRVCASPVSAVNDLPGFDNAAVDGYAVHSADTTEATPEAPVRLRVTARIAAGQAPTPGIEPGACARIFTGAMLPPGVDAVVMQEDTRPAGEDHVEILASARPWEGVRFAGGDVRRGTVVATAGRRLRPTDLGLLAAAGIGTLAVHRRPRLSLLSTGSELVDPGQPLAPGQLVDSNQVLLRALATAAGVEVKRGARLADSLEATATMLKQAASDSDVVVTTGGVSVGDADVVKAAVARIGGSVELWRIALKPGKPFAWGRVGSASWFGLPGNPVSAFVAWHLLALPALRGMEGDRNLAARRGRGRLAEAIANRGDRRHFLRVTVQADGEVRPAGPQASHIQSGLALADALLDVPPGVAWEAGREVDVEWLD